MRCTKEIKSKINIEVGRELTKILYQIDFDIEKEHAKISAWRLKHVKDLEDKVKPVVTKWAVELKRNYSYYKWPNFNSSAELAEYVIQNMTASVTYDDYRYSGKPKISTDKLKSLLELKKDIKSKYECLLCDAYIQVADLKSLDQLDSLIEETKRLLSLYVVQAKVS